MSASIPDPEPEIRTARRNGSSAVPTSRKHPLPLTCARGMRIRQYFFGYSNTTIHIRESRGIDMAERLETVDEIVEKYAVISNPVKSKIYVGLGSIFVVFAIIGIWVPGWPTVSWAVPAAFLFSLSNENLFRWTLTNKFFGPSMFEYYATGKTLPRAREIRHRRYDWNDDNPFSIFCLVCLNKRRWQSIRYVFMERCRQIRIWLNHHTRCGIDGHCICFKMVKSRDLVNA